MQISTFLNKALLIRLVLALLVGLLLGMIAGKVGAGLQNVFLYLLFPLFIGVIGSLTVGARHEHPYLLSLATGLIAWFGVGIYLLVLSSPPPCSVANCANTSNLAALLTLYFLTGFPLAAVSALITCAIVRYYRTTRESS